MKKILSIIICFVLLSGVCNTGFTPLNILNIFNLTASADEETTSGQCGDNLYWSFDADTYTLTISGTGDMYDYGGEADSNTYYSNEEDRIKNAYMNNPAPWDAFRTEIRKIDIQPGCTSIGDFAFFRCWYVGGIIFPEGIITIGDYIFTNTVFSISKVYFPSTLENIGEHFCVVLNSATYNHRLISCFGGNEELVSFGYEPPFYNRLGFLNAKTFGDYILDVDEQTKTAEIVAYVGCDEQINIPQRMGDYIITGIGFSSFYNCAFTKRVTIPETVSFIGANAFFFTSIENFYISKNVSKIGENAFLSVTPNYSIHIANDPYYVFDDGYPDQLTTLDENGHAINYYTNELAYIPALNSITVDSQNQYFSSDESGVLYNKNKTVLFQYPVGSSRKSFAVPSTVKSIWNCAFTTSCNSELTRVYIPKNVSLLTYGLFDAGMIVDYEGSQSEWNSLVSESYPSYPELPNTYNYNCDYYNDPDYINYDKILNDLILYTQKYNYYYEGKIHYPVYNDTYYWIDQCTINFNITDPMNGVTPDSITYSWSSDGKSCTGTAVYNDFNRTVTENATVTSSVYSNAACTAPGTTRYTAAFNNTVFSTQYKNVQDIPALGHSNKWVVTTTATCTREGVESYRCSRCGTVFETRTVDKLPHSYISTVVSPTCTNGGYTTHTCSSCGDTYTDSYTSAAGHRYTEYITKPTCTAQGYTLHYCSVCHDSYKDSFVDPAHTPGNPVVENATNSSCETEGSYDEVVYCTKCGDEISREHKITVAGQHTPAEAVKENAVAATCEKTGSYDLVVYCAICNNELSRQTVTVPKSDHKDANNDGMCDTCKKVTDEAKYKAYLFGKIRFNVKSDEVYKNSKVTVAAKASGVPDGYVLAIYDGGSKPAAIGDSTSVTYEMSELVAQNKTLTVKVIDASGKVQKDGSGKELSAKIEIKVKTGFFDLIIAFFKKLFGANKVTIKP